MQHPQTFCLLLALLACSPTVDLLAQDGGSTATKFGLTKVWAIELSLSPAEYDAMQPALPGPAGAPPVAPTTRPHERNLFGTAFPWVQAEMTAGGQATAKVELRYSGDFTYFVTAQSQKRPFKVNIVDPSGQARITADSLQLHAMPLDPAKAREALAFAMFRACGVPVPQTAFADVTLTVPGRHPKLALGLYTVVAGIDERFIKTHFGDRGGLLMKPARMRGLDFLGEDWTRYAAQYQPSREPSAAEAKRVIEFARLINQASDEDFAAQIGEYLDVDAFLRFMAANAISSNLESFFAFGQNYYLYLDAKTNRFVLLPGDLEFSLANFLLMGTGEQLMDLSVMKPYPGQNKLPDRLLAIDDIKRQYQDLLKQLCKDSVTREQLLTDLAAMEAATKPVREKEAAAVANTKEPPAGFGAGAGLGPQAPDLKTFAEKRFASIESQLAGRSAGFVPQPFGFGGPGGGPPRNNNPKPIDEAAFKSSVSAPPEFEATLFAAAPQVNYPVAIAATPHGVVFVASDEQGSLGRTPNGGKILRCVDHDDDGKVDQVTEYGRVEHPRGICYRGGSLWVMHPPSLSVLYDDDNDGRMDRQVELVTGLTTNQINDRGGDHTTNCARMGVDGWLYIGVGDYGIKQARGVDGATLSLRGGGVVRVRPDGTELELYCGGLRNPFDLAIDPFLNVFTRDNTNDGAGWDTRVMHLLQSGEYGYTRLFANFTDETLPPLGTFGGGGGTGGLFIDEPRWPEGYRQALFTGDWGRSEVYRHALDPAGPTFAQQTDVFLKIPRATGMDIDSQGRLYVASWFGGEASVHVGPNVGFIARVVPKGFEPEPFPKLQAADRTQLVDLLDAPQSVARLQVQGEILRRGNNAQTSQALAGFIKDSARSLAGRVAALWTLKQLDGRESHAFLKSLLDDGDLAEFALRALTDRKTETAGLESGPFVAALTSDRPRVRAQAVISLGRLGDASVAPHLLPLTSRPGGSTMPPQAPVQNQPDPDRVIPHLAVAALRSVNAVDACLAALDGPHWSGALWAMRSMHSPPAVDGLIRKLGTASSPELRRGILQTLIRLQHRETPYDGSWWGIRPDSTGPYYDRQDWELTSRIASVLSTAILDSEPDEAELLKSALAKHRVTLPGIASTVRTVVEEQQKPIVLAPADPNNPEQLGNMSFELALRKTVAAQGDANRGEALFREQSCVACHTTADGQTPKGPHLVDIGKRYKPEELIESILKPSVKIAQGYESYSIATADGKVISGFMVSQSADSIVLREANSVRHELQRTDIEEQSQQKVSAMPDGVAANLTPQQLADLLAYLQSLK